MIDVWKKFGDINLKLVIGISKLNTKAGVINSIKWLYEKLSFRRYQEICMKNDIDLQLVIREERLKIKWKNHKMYNIFKKETQIKFN